LRPRMASSSTDGWCPRRARFTVVWFHGNAGNISHRVSNIGYLHRLLRTNVFIFDYRGYGQSQGGRFSLSEEATYRDAEGPWPICVPVGTWRAPGLSTSAARWGPPSPSN